MEHMDSHRPSVAVALFVFLATGCSLDATGLPVYDVSAGSADAGADNIQIATDTGAGSRDVSASADASDRAMGAAFDSAEAIDGTATIDSAPTIDSTAAIDSTPAVDSASAIDGHAATDTGSDTGSFTTFAFGTTTPTAQWGDSLGTTTYNAMCPANEVIVGFRGSISTVNGYWTEITPVCGTLSIDPGTFAVTVAPGSELAAEVPIALSGGPGPVGGAMTVGGQCGVNQVMIGFTAQDTTAGHVHQIVLDCAPLTITQGGSPSVEWGQVTTIPVGGIPPPTNQQENVSPDILCPSNPAAVAVQTNNEFDALGLVLFGVECSVLTPQ